MRCKYFKNNAAYRRVKRLTDLVNGDLNRATAVVEEGVGGASTGRAQGQINFPLRDTTLNPGERIRFDNLVLRTIVRSNMRSFAELGMGMQANIGGRGQRSLIGNGRYGWEN